MYTKFRSNGTGLKEREFMKWNEEHEIYILILEFSPSLESLKEWIGLRIDETYRESIRTWKIYCLWREVGLRRRG